MINVVNLDIARQVYVTPIAIVAQRVAHQLLLLGEDIAIAG